jgi:hypothetical protein
VRRDDHIQAAPAIAVSTRTPATSATVPVFAASSADGLADLGCADGLALSEAVAGTSAALAFAAVAERVFVVYASFGSAAPQIIEVASSATRAEGLADRYAEEDRYGWQRPNWLECNSARRVSPAVDGRGDAVEVRLVQIGLDELTRFVLETEPLIEEHD